LYPNLINKLAIFLRKEDPTLFNLLVFVLYQTDEFLVFLGFLDKSFSLFFIFLNYLFVEEKIGIFGAGLIRILRAKCLLSQFFNTEGCNIVVVELKPSSKRVFDERVIVT
jgi:hypothetical protein